MRDRNLELIIELCCFSFFCIGTFADLNCLLPGPWVVGEMMRGHFGALFVHGMYLKQHWIPGSLTYYYGIMQVRRRSLERRYLFGVVLFLFVSFFLGSCNVFVWYRMTITISVY